MGPAVTRKMMSFAAVYVALVLLFHCSSVEAKCEYSELIFTGDDVHITCGIRGTCSWPEWKKWKKGVHRITNEGSPLIHPDYAARCSYDTDNKTLIVKNVTQSDEGIYVCACAGHDDSPQTFEVNVLVRFDVFRIENDSKKMFIVSMVLLSAAIIVLFYMVTWTWKMCKQNTNKKNFRTIAIIVLLSLIVFLVWCLSRSLVRFLSKDLFTEIPVDILEMNCEGLMLKSAVTDTFVAMEALYNTIISIPILLALVLVWWKTRLMRRKIQQTIESAFPNHVTEKDLYWHVLGTKWYIIEQQLLDLENKGNIIITRNGSDRVFACAKTVRAWAAYLDRTIQEIFKSAFPDYIPAADLSRVSMKELLQESSVCSDCLKPSRIRRESYLKNMLLQHKQNYPNNFTDEDLGKIISIVSDILHQEAEKQTKDAMDSVAEINLIKQIIGPLFEPPCPNASAAKLLSGIIAYVTEEIIQHDLEIRSDDLNSSTPGISKTNHCLSGLPVGKPIPSESLTLRRQTTGAEHIPEEQELLEDCSDKDHCLSGLPEPTGGDHSLTVLYQHDQISFPKLND